MCKNDFTPNSPTQQYCSKNCYRKNKNNNRNKHTRNELDNLKPRQCPVCEVVFEITPISIKKKYCCENCGRKAERLFGNKTQTDLEYKDQIRFGGNKYKTLERDNYQCQMCENKSQLVIHHKDCSGQSTNANNELSNLITLCRKCHINIHKLLK